MLTPFSIAYGFLMRPFMKIDSTKARESASRLLKSRLDPDRIALGRDEDHDIRKERLACAQSDPGVSGAAATKGGETVAWREWRWTDACTVGPCTFSEARWRFYANGRIAFHAQMENAAGNFRVGNLEGHRIELRTKDGCLLGAWRAAFFVRRSSGIRHFPATILDEHPLVSLHFDELAERQDGIWYFA